MPPLIRRYIKTSFAFLIAGVLLGSYVIVGQYVVGTYPPRLIITAHVHVLLTRTSTSSARARTGTAAGTSSASLDSC